VDYYWEKLADGGNKKARKCGWLKDKYGVSWQIVPTVLPKMISDPGDAAQLSAAPFVLICFFTAFAGSKWRPMTVRSRYVKWAYAG
jgi:3-demethylubiquinone-9 3-methyltransferase